MTVRARFETKGFEAYLEKLAKAGQDVDAAAQEALQAGGEVLLAGMQRRVPKDTGNCMTTWQWMDLTRTPTTIM